MLSAKSRIFKPISSETNRLKEEKIFGNENLKEKIKFCILATTEGSSYFETAVEWSVKQWGYLRKTKADYYREKLNTIKSDFYIMTYQAKPIGMFSLTECKSIGKPRKSAELDYFYVDKEYRQIGMGRFMLKKVLSIAIKQKIQIICLDTLTPALNSFYQKQGAVIVAENYIMGRELTGYFPTTFLVFDVELVKKKLLEEKPERTNKSYLYTL